MKKNKRPFGAPSICPVPSLLLIPRHTPGMRSAARAPVSLWGQRSTRDHSVHGAVVKSYMDIYICAYVQRLLMVWVACFCPFLLAADGAGLPDNDVG